MFGRLLLVGGVLLLVPHGHGDGVVEDEGPYQPQDQLQFAVHDVCGIWITEIERGNEMIGVLGHDSAL